MKSLAFIMALVGLLSMMMLASTTPLHTEPRDAPDTLVSDTLVAVENNHLPLPLPVNEKQLPVPHARRDDPDPPAPSDPPQPGPGLNVVDYNLRNPNFRIPPFVLCPRDGNILQDPSTGWPGGRQNPSAGGRALEPIFSANEVWAAFNQGWQHLMNAGHAGGYRPGQIPDFSRASSEFFDWVTQHWPRWQAGQRFPCEVQTEIWGNVFDWAGWPDEPLWDSTRIFMYPLTIQGHFEGGNSAPAGSAEPVIAPGDYRVIFTDAGVYLGTVRYRPGMPNSYSVMLRTTPRNSLRASWLAPVDIDHQPVAAQDDEGRWNYPGVPIWTSQRPENFLPPLNMALASVLLARWDWVAHRGSRPPPKPRQDMADPPIALPQPQLNNGTLSMPDLNENDLEVDDQGFSHFAWNAATDYIPDPPAEELALMNCRNAFVVVNRTYQVSCESVQNPDTGYLDYHIAVTGTGGSGYHANGWCKQIISGIYRHCGWWFNLKGDVACNTGNATLATFFMDSSIRGDFINHVSGTEMYFSLKKPWDQTDNLHECVAKGIQRGSCADEGIMPTYPIVCRRKDWVDLELSEWDWASLGSA